MSVSILTDPPPKNAIDIYVDDVNATSMNTTNINSTTITNTGLLTTGSIDIQTDSRGFEGLTISNMVNISNASPQQPIMIFTKERIDGIYSYQADFRFFARVSAVAPVSFTMTYSNMTLPFSTTSSYTVVATLNSFQYDYESNLLYEAVIGQRTVNFKTQSTQSPPVMNVDYSLSIAFKRNEIF